MVFLIRHAESYWNSEHLFERDVRITPFGIKQASKLNCEVDLIICSTLRRARQTLDNSNIKYKDVIFSPLCREIKDGNMTNLYPSEENLKETSEMLKKRINDLKNLIKSCSKKYNTIAIISHSVFLYELTGKRFKNCQIMNITL